MKPIIEGPPAQGEAKRPLGRRVLWFIVLWAGGLLTTALIAYALRALLI